AQDREHVLERESLEIFEDRRTGAAIPAVHVQHARRDRPERAQLGDRALEQAIGKVVFDVLVWLDDDDALERLRIDTAIVRHDRQIERLRLDEVAAADEARGLHADRHGRMNDSPDVLPRAGTIRRSMLTRLRSSGARAACKWSGVNRIASPQRTGIGASAG